MAQYDLTHVLCKHMDAHLASQLLTFIKDVPNLYDPEHVDRANLTLLLRTNMIDYAVEVHKKLNRTDDVPVELKERRDAVLGLLRNSTATCGPLLEICDRHDQVNAMRLEKTFTMEYLGTNMGITPAMLSALYRHAKLQFECGNYSGAADYLLYFRSLTSNPEESFQAMWGKLAAEILSLNWEGASEDLKALRTAIDARSGTPPLLQLQQRVWLMHWGLFVFFNHPSGRSQLVEMFMAPTYLNAIETSAPHLLRYLTAAVVVTQHTTTTLSTASLTSRQRNNTRHSLLMDLVETLSNNDAVYSDPITEFFQCLYLKFDFEKAQAKLEQALQMLSVDYFLAPMKAGIMDAARVFVFETFCRIHTRIDLPMLAAKLNLGEEEAELWIVNLIRNSRLDARIDSEARCVLMGSKEIDLYQNVIEKTKVLSFRSHVLANNVEKRAATLASKVIATQGMPNTNDHALLA